MSHLRLFVAAIARPTFDVALAQEATNRFVAALRAAGVAVNEGAGALILHAEAAEAVVESIAVEEPDLLILFQATFADSTMAMALARVAHEKGIPILLWATPEVRDGGRLRLNSLCGINLAGHALHLARFEYDYALAQPDDEVAMRRALTLARAGRARRTLRDAQIGLVGEPPAGFETCRYDEGDLRGLLGVSVRRIALQEVFAHARGAAGKERETVLARVRGMAPALDDLDAAAVRGSAGVHVALRAQVEANGLRGLAVRCWPEFFTELGCAACGAMSLLNEDGVPASCEADVNGTVTSLLLQELAESPSFLVDLVAIDAESDTGVVWHCGLAPVSMADPEGGAGVTVHSNRKLPLLFEFGLKPGRVTVARLHRRALHGGREGYALVVGGGEIVRAPRSFGGTNGVIRFDRPALDVLDTIMANGVEHHLSVVYGDVREELRAFARIAHLDVLELT